MLVSDSRSSGSSGTPGGVEDELDIDVSNANSDPLYDSVLTPSSEEEKGTNHPAAEKVELRSQLSKSMLPGL